MRTNSIIKKQMCGRCVSDLRLYLLRVPNSFLSEQIDKGLSVGDIDLGYKPKKAYEDAAKEFRVNKAKY